MTPRTDHVAHGLAAIACSLALALIFGPSRADEPSQLLSISAPGLALKVPERVVGFDLSVKSGRVVRLRSIPVGWSVTVDNDGSWTARAKGSISVGAAAVEGEYFDRFVVVERNNSLGLPFDVALDIEVTTDFQHVRTVHVPLKSMHMLVEGAGSSAPRRGD